MKTRFRIALISLLIVLSLAPWAWAAQVSLRILYVNDFHGFAETHQSAGSQTLRGGIAYLAGAVDRERCGQASLLVAAGDMIQGDLWADLFQGRSVIDVMNAMRFDAMTVGNHEFYQGLPVLRARIAQAEFPVLGANVEGSPSLKPYVIKQLNGVKIGIIGVVTPTTAATHPENVAGLKFSSPESALRRYLPELKRQADIIVVLSHCGYPVDQELAAQVPGIDIIVGGHTHTKILHPELVGHTIIVQAWEHAKALGVLDLQIKDGKIVGFQGTLKEISPETGAPDPRIQKMVAHYGEQAHSIMQQVIGDTRVDLDGKNVRSEETNLGDFIADVMRQAAGADVAVINGGSLKASIPRGPIKRQELYQALPFRNYLVTARLTGAQLKLVLEHGVSSLEQPAGRFPQVSGLTFTYSQAAPAGARIQNLTVGGQPVILEKSYLVATIDFLAAGGDGYKIFAEASQGVGGEVPSGGSAKPGLSYFGPAISLRALVISAIEARKSLAPKIEGRIRAVD